MIRFLADENFNNDELELILLASDQSDWEGKIEYVPF